MFNMAVRLLKCLSYLHNNCTFIIKVLIITTNEDDDLVIGRSDMVVGHYYILLLLNKTVMNAFEK